MFIIVLVFVVYGITSGHRGDITGGERTDTLASRHFEKLASFGERTDFIFPKKSDKKLLTPTQKRGIYHLLFSLSCYFLFDRAKPEKKKVEGVNEAQSFVHTLLFTSHNYCWTSNDIFYITFYVFIHNHVVQLQLEIEVHHILTTLDIEM